MTRQKILDVSQIFDQSGLSPAMHSLKTIIPFASVFTVLINCIGKAAELTDSAQNWTISYKGVGVFIIFLASLISYLIFRKKLKQTQKELQLREGKLSRCQNHLKHLFESSPSAFCLVDDKGQILDASRNFLQMMGYQLHEIVGRKIQGFFQSPLNEEKAEIDLEVALLKFEDSEGIKGVCQTKNGVKLDAALTFSPDPNMRIKGSARHLIFIECKSLSNPIENDSGKIANPRGNNEWFEDNLAHEIRTPLNAILGFSQVLMNRVDAGGYPVDFKELLNNIRISGQELMRLINHLIETFKPGIAKISEEEHFKQNDPFFALQDGEVFSNNSVILVVDDNSVNLDLMKSFFLDLGLEIESAENGVEGVQKMAELVPDLVLMDIRMPEMDGLQAIRQIRKTQKIKSIPVIALSAEADLERKQEALAAGFNDYLAKPFDMDDLTPVLARYLEKEAIEISGNHSDLDLMPEETESELQQAFQNLSSIPRDLSNELIEQIDIMKYLIQPYKTNYLQVLHDMENAVYECNNKKLDHLIIGQLKGLDCKGDDTN
jgi:PAS domain S-box-containing protein